MYGGTVRNNWLGSYSNEQFYGDRVVGEVGNPSGAGAGVHVTDGATFNMSYGRINNNHITAGGNTSWGAGGGGVAVRGVGTTFNMDGGIIRANSRPGWLPNYGCVGRYSESGTINTGAGLGHGSGTGGGGIYLTEGAVVTLSGNAEVHYNTARRGGGISMEGRAIGAFPTSLDVATRTNYNPSGASGNGPINGFTTWDESVVTILNITGNARIHGNLTLEGWANASGGGLFVGPHSEVRMFSGAIENNVQTNGVEAWTVNGGGARVTSRGHFIMMGGYIRNNVALHATVNEPQGGLGGAIRPDRVPRRAIGGGLAARSDRNSPAGGPLRADGSRLNDARITIFGGEISGNEAGRGGGIGMNANSTVIIHGGSIVYNYAVGWPATGTGTGANAYRTAGTAGGGIGTFEATLDGINASMERLFIRPNAEVRDNRAVGLANMTTRGTGLLAGPSHWTNIHGERSRHSVLEMGTTGVGRNISLPANFPHPTLEQIRATGHHLIINDNFFRDHGDYHHLPMNPPADGRNPWRISPGTITEGHLHPFNNFDIGTARMAVLYPALGVQPYFEGLRQDPVTDDTDFYVAHWGVAQVSVPETAANTARHAHSPRYDATLQYWRSSNFTNPPLNVMVGRPMMNIQARQFANSTAIVNYQYSTANPVMLNIREEQPRYLEVHWLDTVRNPASMTVVPAEEYVEQGRSVDLTARIQSQFYAMEDYVYERHYFPLRFWDITNNNYIYVRDNAGNQMYDFRIQRVQENGEDVRVRVKDRVETLPIVANVTSDETVSVFHYLRGADQADDCELNLEFHNHAAPISATDTLGQGGGDERTRTREVPVIFPPQSISWVVTRVDGTPEPGATVTVDRDGNITLNVTRDVEPGDIIVRGTVDGSDVTGEMRIEVQELAARFTFHAYGIGNFGTDADNNPITYVEIPVDFDENIDLSIIENYLVSEEDAFAFWGWFTHEGLRTGIPRADLDEYGRRASQSDGVLRRRPAVGTFGFEGGFGPTVNAAGFTRVLSFSEAEWDAISDDDSNLELFAIWSLWGDVNDDDRVNSDDLRELTWHVGQLSPRPTLNLSAADVHRNGVVNSDDLRELTWYVGQLFPRPVLGQRATPPPAPIASDDMAVATDSGYVAEEDTIVYDIPEYAYDTYEYVTEEYAYEELYTSVDEVQDNRDAPEEALLTNESTDPNYVPEDATTDYAYDDVYEYVDEEDDYAEFYVFYTGIDGIMDEVLDGTGVTDGLLTNEATEVNEAAETIIEEAAAAATAASVAGQKLPQTGVEGTMLLWASLMTLALMLALGAVAEIKKRKDSEDT